MRRTTVYLSREVHEKAKLLCRKFRTSMSSVVNKLLSDWVSQNYKQLRLDVFNSEAEAVELYRARRRFIMEWLRFQPHYKIRCLEQWLKRPEEVNIEWVTSMIGEAEELLEMARDLGMN